MSQHSSDPATSSLTGSGVMSDTTLTMSSADNSIVTDPTEGPAPSAIPAHVVQDAIRRVVFVLSAVVFSNCSFSAFFVVACANAFA